MHQRRIVGLQGARRLSRPTVKTLFYSDRKSVEMATSPILTGALYTEMTGEIGRGPAAVRSVCLSRGAGSADLSAFCRSATAQVLVAPPCLGEVDGVRVFQWHSSMLELSDRACSAGLS